MEEEGESMQWKCYGAVAKSRVIISFERELLMKKGQD